jgi:hypothetical protein
MSELNRFQARELLPAWLVCVMAPAPAILVAKSGAAGVMYFFVACASLVAYAFRREAGEAFCTDRAAPVPWRGNLVRSAMALFAAWLVFALLSATLRSPHAFVASLLGLLLIVPCLCIVPYMVLITRQPFAAVVFSLTLVVLVKLAGCIIVVASYGWDADDYGHTSMPWLRPNLLVWSFWIGTSVLSAACLFLGDRRWHLANAGSFAIGAPPQ